MSKFEDLIDFIQQSMNQTGSQQVKRRLRQELERGLSKKVIRERKGKIVEAGHFSLGDRA